MKVGDLVKLKPSVLHESANLDMFDKHGKPPEPECLGVIVSRHQNAIKVHWFGDSKSSPPKSQYVLKLIVVSEL